MNNITTNEKLNIDRYQYLSDIEGNPKNRFDNGAISNFLEFLRYPGYSKNYRQTFEETFFKNLRREIDEDNF